MFQGLKDMGKLVAQAGEMKKKMADVQKRLKTLKVVGQNRAKTVTVTLTGELECVSIDIAPSIQGTPSLHKELADAFNDAALKAKTLASQQLSEISAGLNIPGLT